MECKNDCGIDCRIKCAEAHMWRLTERQLVLTAEHQTIEQQKVKLYQDLQQLRKDGQVQPKAGDVGAENGA